MSFLDNIFSCFNNSSTLLPLPKILLIGDNCGYFEGVKSIGSYSEKEIILFTKQEKIIVLGNKLVINKFCEGDVVICGKILTIKKD